MKNRIFSLDISRDRVICAASLINSDGRIESFLAEKRIAFGIEKGRVVDLNLLTKSIKDCADSLQEKIDERIYRFYVNLLNKDIKLKEVKGVILLKDTGNKVVDTEDIDRLIQTSCSLNLNKDEILLHKIKKRFILDDRIIPKEPVGLSGYKLGLELSLVTSSVVDIENISKAIQNAGFGVKNFVFSGLSKAKVLPHQDRKFVLIDVGRDLTQLLTFDGEILRDFKIFDFGYEDLIRRLAESLTISFLLAEELIETCGSLESTDREISVKTGSSYKSIKKRKISDVLCSSLNTILGSLKRKIPEDLYPEGLVAISGDIVLLEGFLEFAESTLGLPVTMVRVKNLLSYEDSVACVGNFGLSLLAIEEVRRKRVLSSASSLILKFLRGVKNIYRDYF